jgi:hypothetical protein
MLILEQEGEAPAAVDIPSAKAGLPRAYEPFSVA